MPQPRDTELTQIDELIQNGDWKEALAACHTRLSQNPDCLATQRHGLTSAWCLGCFDDAIGFADRILAQQPFDAPVLTTKGLLCLVTNDLPTAESALSTAVGFAQNATQKELARKTLNLTRELMASRSAAPTSAVIQVEQADDADLLSA